MSADRSIAREDVAVLLASALGQDKSAEVVASSARRLGISHGGFTADDVNAIFEILVKLEGLVGVVARFAVSRGDVAKLIAKAAETQSSPSPQPRRASTVDIMPLISPALGTEKARDAIAHAAARRGIHVDAGLSHSDVLAILDEMTKVEGIVGVVARFAKARFLLNPSE